MKFKRKQKQDDSVVIDPVAHFAKILAEELRRQPFHVKHEHDIRRNIPIPRTMTLWITDGQNFRRAIGHIDMSYKGTIPVTFSQHLITGREEDHGKQVAIEGILDYDPRDR